MHVPRGQAGARALLAGLVLSGLCAVLLVSLHAVPAPHGYFALRSESLVSLPMDTMMRELHGMPSDILPGATEKLSSSGQSSSSGGVHSMLHDDAPLPSDPYDGVNNLVSVKDTTGRTLTPEAISASGLSDDGDLSDNDLAVLEAAGTLKPRVAKLHRGGELPPYIEVAQRAAIRDAENGEDDSNFLDATPGEIVTIRDTRVDPRVQARKAKKVLDSLNSGYAQSMQKWLTGSDKVGDVLTAIDSRSASYLANTGDMGKAIDAQTEKAILDTADKQHYHEKKGLVQSEAEEGEIPQEARDVVGKDRQGQDRDGVQNLNAMLEAEKKVPSDGPDPSDEGVVHTPDGFVLRIDPKAAGKSSPMRPLSAKAHLAMLAARPARVESLLPIDPTRHRHDTNAAARHDGYDEPTGPNKDFQVHAVPELGDFRDKMEWQKHPFERQPAEDKEYWKTSEDEYPPQDATMVFGAGRLRRESKTQAVHNPYGWLGARGAEVPVTTADSEDTLTGGIAGGYVDGAGVSTRSSLESGSKLCQLVNCYNRGAIPMPPAARVRQQGLRMQALSEERKRPFLGDEIFDLGVDNGYNNGDVIMDPESDEGDANLRGMYYGPITARKQRRMQALSEERKRPFLGDEIFDLGVDNGYNNGDVIMDPESDEGDANLRGMYYGPITARKQRRMALAFWGQGNRFLRAAEPRQDRALMQLQSKPVAPRSWVSVSANNNERGSVSIAEVPSGDKFAAFDTVEDDGENPHHIFMTQREADRGAVARWKTGAEAGKVEFVDDEDDNSPKYGTTVRVSPKDARVGAYVRYTRGAPPGTVESDAAQAAQRAAQEQEAAEAALDAEPLLRPPKIVCSDRNALGLNPPPCAVAPAAQKDSVLEVEDNVYD